MKLSEVQQVAATKVGKLTLDRVIVLLMWLNDPDGIERQAASEVISAFKSHRAPLHARDMSDAELLETIANLSLKLSEGNKLRLIEDRIVGRAFVETKGNKSAAARLLGIERKALERRLVR